MKYSKYISLISGISDLVILNFYFNFIYCYHNNFSHSCFSITPISFFIFINLSWIVLSNIFNVYKDDRQPYKKDILLNYIITGSFFFILFLLYFQLISFNYLSRDQIKFLFPAFFLTIIAGKFILYYMIVVYRKMGYNYRNIIILGYNDTATKLKDYFVSNPFTGYRFKGFFTLNKSDKKEIVGTFDELEEFVNTNKIDEIYIMTNNMDKSVYNNISSLIGKHAVKIRLVPDISDFSFMSVKLVNYDLIPVIKIEQGPLSYWLNRVLKRLLDLFISLFTIIFILSWLIPFLGIINLFSGNGRLFFRQKRSGLDNRTFKVIKFRTMKKNNNCDTKQAVEGDERITKIGKFLRRTSIDELPQFFNVLFGEMSVVGPRPHMLKHTEEYKAVVSKFMIRHAVKPGITGYAQVRGYRGEIKKIKDMRDRIKLDVSYIENWSLSLDIKIILLTIRNVFRKEERAY